MFTYTSAIRGFHKFHISEQRLSTARKTEVHVFLETYKKSKKKTSLGTRIIVQRQEQGFLFSDANGSTDPALQG